MFKTATLALAAIAASATIASADNYISNFIEYQDRDTQVELGTVRASGDGVVEIYAYHGGELGALLGSEAVTAGANKVLNVDILRSNVDAIAVLKVGGQIVDTQEIEFN